MKYRHRWWAFFPLLVPLIALCGLFVPSGCGGGSSGTSAASAAPTPGNVAIALLMVPPPGNFRSVLLNISSIRINKFPNAALNQAGWVSIPVPSQSGNGRGSSPGDLQVDMEQTQTGATFYNIGGVPQSTYATVQVVVDPNNPGTIIPACQSPGADQEGCIGYPMVFQNASQGVVIDLPTVLPVAKNSTAVLLIQLSLDILSTPPATGGFYSMQINGSQANPQSFMAQVTGKVNKTGTPSGAHLIPLKVTAELSGTNTVIESAPVTKDQYTLNLPALPVTGTTYDIFASGGGFTYDVAPQAVTLVPGQLLNTLDFSVSAQPSGSLSGTIADTCTGLTISGATVNLLAPRSGAVPSPAPSTSFCESSPQDCIVVASTSTDQAGKYPLPFTVQNPTPFNQVPSGNQNFALQASASGYTDVLSGATTPNPSKATCDRSNSSKDCSFSLPTSFINGTVSLAASPPPGSSVQVQVFAENSGTNQLVGALPMPLVFTNQVTTLPFTMNVPFAAMQNFDLFAAAIDPYLGSPAPFPGHDIQVVAAVPGAAAQCQTSAATATIPPLDCTGHGSITGTVVNGSPSTTVEVIKNGVQLMGTAPNLFSSNAPQNNAYTLCVPPDTYTLQRADNGTPGATQTITVPEPAAVSSPCPSTCSSDSNQSMCPGQCNITQASPL